MKIRVLYFAGAREVSSARDELVALGDKATVEDLASEVFRLHPALKRMERSIRFSVNLEVAEAGSRLQEGDEVGVLPPVAGG